MVFCVTPHACCPNSLQELFDRSVFELMSNAENIRKCSTDRITLRCILCGIIFRCYDKVSCAHINYNFTLSELTQHIESIRVLINESNRFRNKRMYMIQDFIFICCLYFFCVYVLRNMW